jgi:bifunctional UDP-N-acetylglucosamine pyrophosphorylase / glucosamine-1-phosphate N-acetyltransferase
MTFNVVILAAGKGKRMHTDLPKVLHPLAGQPLLAHVIAAARALKPARICVVYGHGGEQVPDAVRAKDLIFVKQTPQRGTGHAVLQALPHLKSGKNTLVLYGDVPLISAETLLQLTAGGANRLRILTAELDDPHGYGRIVRTKSGEVSAIVEEKDADARQRRLCEINTGIMLLPGKSMAGWLAALSNHNAQREYYLTDVVKFALKDRVKIETCAPRSPQEILGVNTKSQLAQIERIFQRRVAAHLMDSGVTLADPMRIDVRGELRCGRDVRVDVNCIFEGKVEIGDGVSIGAHCIIKNARIGATTQIAPFSMIDDAEVGQNCRVGPYARIRPGTRLARNVHIGNFVEVKASSLGAGSKANHLSYVGDASVGREVNIGAGTITCNYDGASKHRTVIEDDVFIGSDTQLIAPVTVRRGATIGAGTTVTRDAPPGQLTLSRAKQVSVRGWTRPAKPAKRKK